MKKHIIHVLFTLLFVSSVFAQEVWMPDESLQNAIKEKLNIADGTTLRIPDMRRLYDLVSFDDNIGSLQGLEFAVNLAFLHIGDGSISDLTPLASLSNLRVLKLLHHNIRDVSPLAALVGLEILQLQDNQIVDISPLSNLRNLKELKLHANRIEDFSPLSGLLNLEILTFHENASLDISPLLHLNLRESVSEAVCELERLPIHARLENRDYPSIFSAWHNIINRQDLSWKKRLTYHDLYFCCLMFGTDWRLTPDGMKIVGDVSAAKAQRDALLAENPNIVFLVPIYYYGDHPSRYPEDWPYWLRDASGNRVQAHTGWVEGWIDYTHPGAQDYFVQQAIAVAECGLYDGIFLDHWSEEPRLRGHRSLASELKAKDTILRRIRQSVPEDFLILVNSNHKKIPRWASDVNGLFMETRPGFSGGNVALDDGYTDRDLTEIQETLLWADQTLREPRINCLEGYGIRFEEPDSDLNRKWMRFFTTMSLTLSNGYVVQTMGIDTPTHEHLWDTSYLSVFHQNEGVVHDHTHQHYYYDFWATRLGRPVGEKGQLYNGVEGLFIREFGNGWAVYNRSGAPQALTFNEKVSGVENGITNTIHILDDLDGEIYLKASLSADVNADGDINILDLVAIAQAFGETSPDVNGDGVVNILDLVFVSGHIQ